MFEEITGNINPEESKIKSMNYIFGKNSDNNWFTHEELFFANGVDLLNDGAVQKAKNDWINSYFD